MSDSPPAKIHCKNALAENCKGGSFDRQRARTFISWYKQMVDRERQNLTLYLSDDAVLEWFGRTVKTRKKVSNFLKHDMQCSRHNFTTVECIEKITNTRENTIRKGEIITASPMHSPEMVTIKSIRPAKRRNLRSNCKSPDWADGCVHADGAEINHNKIKFEDNLNMQEQNYVPSSDACSEINNQGDCVIRGLKRKCIPITPPNKEVGQGDCMPSTSNDSEKSHENLTAQLTKHAVECNGYIEFTRIRNNVSSDGMKWERKCKVQISYSEDPLNIGEYIIWFLRYSDESKCRRNLLAAFEEVEKDDMMKKSQINV